jgi:hypothetical protein
VYPHRWCFDDEQTSSTQAVGSHPFISLACSGFRVPIRSCGHRDEAQILQGSDLRGVSCKTVDPWDGLLRLLLRSGSGGLGKGNVLALGQDTYLHQGIRDGWLSVGVRSYRSRWMYGSGLQICRLPAQVTREMQGIAVGVAEVGGKVSNRLLRSIQGGALKHLGRSLAWSEQQQQAEADTTPGSMTKGAEPSMHAIAHTKIRRGCMHPTARYLGRSLSCALRYACLSLLPTSPCTWMLRCSSPAPRVVSDMRQASATGSCTSMRYECCKSAHRPPLHAAHVQQDEGDQTKKKKEEKQPTGAAEGRIRANRVSDTRSTSTGQSRNSRASTRLRNRQRSNEAVFRRRRRRRRRCTSSRAERKPNSHLPLRLGHVPQHIPNHNPPVPLSPLGPKKLASESGSEPI